MPIPSILGTKVTATDVETGESDSVTIRDNYVVICDGSAVLTHTQVNANGTHVVTIKGVRP